MGTNKAFWRVEKIMNWESALKAGPKCLMCEDEEGNSIPMEKVYSKQVGNKWKEIALKHKLDIAVTDFKPLITFKFQYGKLNSALYTLFIQEMLKRGYIASNSIYLSYAHKNEDMLKYFTIIDEVFKYIKKCIDTNSVLDALETKIKEEGFKRLN